MPGKKPPIMEIGVDVRGVERMRRKLKEPDKEVIGEPWRKLMEALGEVAQNTLAAEGPIGATGGTVAQLYHRVQQAPVPMWVRVGTRAKRVSAKHPRGYPYPKRVNYDPRSPRKGWWERGLKRAHSRINRFLDRAAKEIENRWGH